MVLDPELLKILACPACKKKLMYDAGADVLACAACNRRFSIQNGIPNLIVDEH